jgi:hypothetical protein
MKKIIKSFNCLEMKRKGAEKVLAQTHNLSFEEELSFWKQGTKKLQALQKARRNITARPSSRFYPSEARSRANI